MQMLRVHLKFSFYLIRWGGKKCQKNNSKKWLQVSASEQYNCVKWLMRELGAGTYLINLALETGTKKIL